MNMKHCHHCNRPWPHEHDAMCSVQPCKTCGDPSVPAFVGAYLCSPCWEVERRLAGYLMAPKGVDFVLKALAQRFRLRLEVEAVASAQRGPTADAAGPFAALQPKDE